MDAVLRIRALSSGAADRRQIHPARRHVRANRPLVRRVSDVTSQVSLAS